MVANGGKKQNPSAGERYRQQNTADNLNRSSSGPHQQSLKVVRPRKKGCWAEASPASPGLVVLGRQVSASASHPLRFSGPLVKLLCFFLGRQALLVVGYAALGLSPPRAAALQERKKRDKATQPVTGQSFTLWLAKA